jgi:hypothetical protein
MFADMVGYTAVSQRNESLALELVDKLAQTLRPIIVKHSGRDQDHGERLPGGVPQQDLGCAVRGGDAEGP